MSRDIQQLSNPKGVSLLAPHWSQTLRVVKIWYSTGAISKRRRTRRKDDLAVLCEDGRRVSAVLECDENSIPGRNDSEKNRCTLTSPNWTDGTRTGRLWSNSRTPYSMYVFLSRQQPLFLMCQYSFDKWDMHTSRQITMWTAPFIPSLGVEHDGSVNREKATD